MLFQEVCRYLLSKLPIRLRCVLQSMRHGGSIRMGSGSYIHSSVHMLGKDNISVGSNTCVSEGCWLNVNHGNKIGQAITIGDNCFVGKQNFFTSGDFISIGDYTLTAIGCKFIGSTHKFDDPEVPYLLTGTTSKDRIKIGVNCFVGAGATVLGHVDIGCGSIIGSNSLVLKDVPPFSVVVGNPAVVVKQYSFSKKKWLPVSFMLSDDYVGAPSEQEYLSILKNKFNRVNMPWIAAGKSMGDI